MGITVLTTAATTNLATSYALQEVLGADVETYYPAVERLIAAASASIERYTGRIYARQTYQEKLNGSGSDVLLLTHSPIVGTPVVLCSGEPVVDFEVLDAEASELYREAGWAQGAWVGWDAEEVRVPTSNPVFTVTYTAGYLLPGEEGRNLPADVEQACIETVATWYRRSRRDGDVASKKVGDLAITYATQTGEPFGLPAAARALLPRRLV